MAVDLPREHPAHRGAPPGRAADLPAVPGDRERPLDTARRGHRHIAIGSLIFGLSNGEQHGFGSTGSLAAFAAFVVFGGAFVAIERTRRGPDARRSRSWRWGIRRVLVRRDAGRRRGVRGPTRTSSPYTSSACWATARSRPRSRWSPPCLSLVIGSTLAQPPPDRALRGEDDDARRARVARGGPARPEPATDDSAYLTHVLPGLVLTPFGGGSCSPRSRVGMTAAVTAGGARPRRRPLPAAQQVGELGAARHPRDARPARPATQRVARPTGTGLSYLVAGGVHAVTAVFVV